VESGSGSLEALREANRLRVVDALRREGTASRTDLVRITGLSRTTITTLVGDLQSRGLVIEDADGHERPDKPGRGRPPVLLRLAPPARAVGGVDFGHRHVRVAVADLSSTVLAERRVDMDVDAAASTALDAASGMVTDVLREAGVRRDQVAGAGMGLPGPIDRRTGTVGSSVILAGWAGVNAASELSRRLGMRVEVDNDANLGALAELSLGAGRGVEDLIYVKVSSGIGAGLVLGGRLHRGATGIAGEIGHVQVRTDGAVCRCGNRGCLKTVAGERALAALLRPRLGRDVTVRDLIELVEAGDLGATRLVGDAGRAIGRVLADLCNALNPEAIIVGGELSRSGTPLLEGIRESVDRYALPSAAQGVRVLRGELGERAEVIGALALVIANTEGLTSRTIPAIAAHGPVAQGKEVRVGST